MGGGGFLIDDAEDTNQNVANKNFVGSSLDSKGILYPLSANPKCSGCGSIEIIEELNRKFSVLVCEECRIQNSSKYSLLSKVEAKREFLLTDEELNDSTALPYISRPNPHNPRWNDMHLYLRLHLQQKATDKWGSMEGLEAEKERRETQIKSRKQEKFKQKLRDLRARTVKAARKSLNSHGERHVHAFKRLNGIEKCVDCGLVIEEELI